MTPLRWLYAVLGVVTLASVVLYLLRDSLGGWASDWMPNVGTSALAILVTLLFVDTIVKRREAERVQPRVEAATDLVTEAYHYLVTGIASDYIETHVGNYEEPPKDIAELLAFWFEHYEDEDTPRAGRHGEPSIVRTSGLVEKMLERAWRDDEAFLEPSYVVAVRDLAMRLRQVSTFYYLREALASNTLNVTSDEEAKAERAHVSATLAVEPARDFLEVYRNQPGAMLSLTEADKSQLRGSRIIIKTEALRRRESAEDSASGQAH